MAEEHDMTPERKMIETCACHRIRMASRAVTRAYDEALRPIGLRATQASVLAAIAAEGAMSITAQGRLRLEKAMPLWEEAQRRLKREIGARQWDDVQQSLDHLIRGSAPSR